MNSPRTRKARKPFDLDEILLDIESQAEKIVTGIGYEAIRVYAFLCDEFARGRVDNNYLFQFVYRSFYRLDNAGLDDSFKTKYFKLMEERRTEKDIDLRAIALELHDILNRRQQQSLQFSFVTKLANMINSEYPIYDALVAKAFGFLRPVDKDFQVRLDHYIKFYESLRGSYVVIRNRNLLKESRRMFHEKYSDTSEEIPGVKVLDFIFWSYGRLKSSSAEIEPSQIQASVLP